MISNFIKALNEPFPESEPLPKQFQFIADGLACFITLFLYLFQPFGSVPISGAVVLDLLRIRFSYLFLRNVFFEWFTSCVLKLQKDLPSWTLLKWILSTMGLLVFIAIGNYLFINFIMNGNFNNGTFFFEMLYNTILVGIIPVVFSGIITQNKARKRNETSAAIIQSQLHPTGSPTPSVQLTAQNGHQKMECLVTDLFFLEAMQNYTAVHYKNDNVLEKTMLRNTLTALEQQLENTPIFRCHRSYLVNVDLIEKVEGNAQGLRLYLKAAGEIVVPVSRKYIEPLKARL